MIRVIFFDAAGTLIRTREPVGRIYARLARNFGVNASEAEVAAGFERAFGNAPGLAFGPNLPPDQLRRMEKQWWRERVLESFAGLGTFRDFESYFEALFSTFANWQTWCLLEGALETLETLRSRGFSLGIVSNFDARLYGILSGWGILDYFASVTISSEAGFAKPSPEIFQAALRKHSAEASEAVHVGDSPVLDGKGASRAGLKALLLASEGDHEACWAEQGIEVVRALPEAAQVILRLNGGVRSSEIS